MKRFVLFLLLAIFLAACSGTPTAPTAAQQAENTLINFFTLLSAKKYAEADSLYGDTYDHLQIFSPDAKDHAALWKGACEQSGLQCLPARSTTLTHQEENTYVFEVKFNNPDGSLFVLGPCCGSNATEMPPVSKFEYSVMKNAQGKFVVMNLPPYVP
jgi:hypothetical protein